MIIARALPLIIKLDITGRWLGRDRGAFLSHPTVSWALDQIALHHKGCAARLRALERCGGLDLAADFGPEDRQLIRAGTLLGDALGDIINDRMCVMPFDDAAQDAADDVIIVSNRLLGNCLSEIVEQPWQYQVYSALQGPRQLTRADHAFLNAHSWEGRSLAKLARDWVQAGQAMAAALQRHAQREGVLLADASLHEEEFRWAKIVRIIHGCIEMGDPSPELLATLLGPMEEAIAIYCDQPSGERLAWVS